MDHSSLRASPLAKAVKNDCRYTKGRDFKDEDFIYTTQRCFCCNKGGDWPNQALKAGC